MGSEVTTAAMAEGAEQRDVLVAFHRALTREQHNLARWPDSLRQQLYNRLQWEETTRAFVEAAVGRKKPGAGPWARIATPFAESPALVRTLFGHDFWVTDCAVSPAGDLLASASTACVILWDLETGVRRLQVDAGGVCSFGSHGSAIVTAVNAPDDGAVSVWDTSTGALLRTSKSIRDRVVECCAVSPDGALIVSGHRSGAFVGGSLLVWDEITLEERAFDEFQHRDCGMVDACAWTPDATWVVFTDRSGALRVINAATGDTSWEPPVEQQGWGEIRAVAVSPDGRLLAEGGTYRLVVLDITTGEVVARLEEGGPTVNSCRFSPDGSLLVSGRDDGVVELWDVASGERHGALTGHGDGVLCSAFSPDGALLITGARDRTLKIWDISLAGKGEAPTARHDGSVRACVAAPDGSFLLTGGEDGLLSTWDFQTGARLRVLPEPAGRVDEAFVSTGRKYWEDGEVRYLGGRPLPGLTDCAVGPDAAFAVCVSSNKTLKTWDLRTGDERATWQGHDYPIYGCAVSPDGAFLVTAAADETVRIWEAESGEELQILEGHANFTDCAVSPDGGYLVAGGSRGAVQLWNPAKSERVRTMGASAGVCACAVSPDGSVVVAVTEDGSVNTWDAETGDAMLSARAHEGDTATCAITPDGLLVASAGSDYAVRVLRISDGVSVLTVPVSASPAALALHPWLPILAWGDTAGSVFVARLVDIEYGPIVVAPFTRGREVVALCPACQSTIPVGEGHAAHTVRCPTAGCALELLISERVRRDLRWKRRRAKRSARRTSR